MIFDTIFHFGVYLCVYVCVYIPSKKQEIIRWKIFEKIVPLAMSIKDIKNNKYSLHQNFKKTLEIA